MVLNEIVRGAAGIAVETEGQDLAGESRGRSATMEDLKAAVESVLEEYTSLNNWHLITVSEETDRDRQDQQVRIVSAMQGKDFAPNQDFNFLQVLKLFKN